VGQKEQRVGGQGRTKWNFQLSESASDYYTKNVRFERRKKQKDCRCLEAVYKEKKQKRLHYFPLKQLRHKAILRSNVLTINCFLQLANVNSSCHAQTKQRRVQFFCWGWKNNVC